MNLNWHILSIGIGNFVFCAYSGRFPVRFSAISEKKIFELSRDAVIALDFDLGTRVIVCHTVLGFFITYLSCET